MEPKEAASHDVYVAGLGGHSIECSVCQAFTIEVKADEDENEVIKQAGFVKCADCDCLICEDCGYSTKKGSICEDCVSDRGQDDYYHGILTEDTPCIEFNGFDKPSTY